MLAKKEVDLLQKVVFNICILLLFFSCVNNNNKKKKTSNNYPELIKGEWGNFKYNGILLTEIWKFNDSILYVYRINDFDTTINLYTYSWIDEETIYINMFSNKYMELKNNIFMNGWIIQKINNDSIILVWLGGNNMIPLKKIK